MKWIWAYAVLGLVALTLGAQTDSRPSGRPPAGAVAPQLLIGREDIVALASRGLWCAAVDAVWLKFYDSNAPASAGARLLDEAFEYLESAYLHVRKCDVDEWASVVEHNPDPRIVPDLSTRDRIIATGRPWRVRDRGTGIRLVLIPRGVYVCGATSGPDQGAFDVPTATVVVSRSFYMGQCEVSQREWLTKMWTNPSRFTAMENPVDSALKGDVDEFMRRAGFRLPWEYEWEYACLGGVAGPWYGELDEVAWWVKTAGWKTHPCGQKLPNGYGLYDTLGNVSEWCEDTWSDRPTLREVCLDPVYTRRGAFVVRGGSFLGCDSVVTSWGRGSSPRHSAGLTNGVRVVRDL